MAASLDDLPPRAALVEIARDFHARGFMLGTAGNLSARVDADHFWITASGNAKGRLTEDDFVLLRVADGGVAETARAGNKPSAEASIHAALYRLDPSAGAVLHGHSVNACLASDRCPRTAKALPLPALEMLKGFDLWAAKPRVALPVFENHLDVDRIAGDIDRRFRKSRPPLTALLVRAHGPTVWGTSLQQAYNRFEVLEFLLAYLARR